MQNLFILSVAIISSDSRHGPALQINFDLLLVDAENSATVIELTLNKVWTCEVVRACVSRNN